MYGLQVGATHSTGMVSLFYDVFWETNEECCYCLVTTQEISFFLLLEQSLSETTLNSLQFL